MTIKKARVIVNTECEKAGITVKELWTWGRTKTISAIRQRIIRRLRNETELSWREIGMLVGLNSKPNKQYVAAGK